YDKNYVENENPNEHINIKELEKRLGEVLVEQQVHYSLGAINLNLWGMLYPQKFAISGNNIELIYSQKGVEDRSPLKKEPEPWSISQEPTQSDWEYGSSF
ncbi:MAG: hypothetical protein KDD40_10800, partial [Bdellovibrionales bacterium]|nr:hypothetical protein [Bdellovibrionales bacterium]